MPNASLIRLNQANCSNLDNADFIPDIASFDGLLGAYFLASGGNAAGLGRLMNHANQDAAPLVPVGSPVYANGYTTVGNGSGFDTGIEEPVSFTIFAVVSAVLNSSGGPVYFVNEFNNDPAALDYGSPLWYAQSTGGFYFTPCYDNGAGATIHSNNTNSLIVTPADPTKAIMLAGVIDAANNQAVLYNLSNSTTPVRTISLGAGVLTARNRTRANGQPVKMRAGVIDDIATTIKDGGLSKLLIWNRPYSGAELGVQAARTRTQLQAAFPNDARFSAL